MIDGQLLSWAVTVVGLIGFHFAGKRVWWSWYINLGCQALWLAYAIVTSTPAFIVSALFYSVVFGNNAKKWTIDKFGKKGKHAHVSKNPGNSRRKAVHRGSRKWKQPRPLGELRKR